MKIDNSRQKQEGRVDVKTPLPTLLDKLPTLIIHRNWRTQQNLLKPSPMSSCVHNLGFPVDILIK